MIKFLFELNKMQINWGQEFPFDRARDGVRGGTTRARIKRNNIFYFIFSNILRHETYGLTCNIF